MEYRYDVLQFQWNKDTNAFYADAWNLVAWMPDGSTHPEAFPNQKKEFFIHNYKTDGFRRFRFRKELIGGIGNEVFTEWIFESEDEIECRIGIEP